MWQKEKNGIFDFFGVQLCFFDENSLNLPILRVFELKRTSVAILFKTAALRSCKFGMTTKTDCRIENFTDFKQFEQI